MYFTDDCKATSWIYEHRDYFYIPCGSDETGSKFTKHLNQKNLVKLFI